jgi:hypothetical protein
MSSNTKAPVFDLKELLRVAQDPGSTTKQLVQVWRLTKSSRVRKAVAANPNADVDIMKMSARLYLKEVLSNPSFELIELFLDDPFIKAVQATYKNPPKSGRLTYPQNLKSSDREIIIRAMLLSPQLTFEGLQSCSSILPSAVFKRDLSSPDVFKRAKELVDKKLGVQRGRVLITDVKDFGKINSLDSREVSLFFKFHDLGLISKAEINSLIYRAGLKNTLWGSDFLALKYILAQLLEGDTDDLAIDNATRAIMVAGASVSVVKIWEKISKDDPNLCKVKDKILRSFVKVFVNTLEFSSNYGWGDVPHSVVEISKTLHECIIDIVIKSRFNGVKKGRLMGLHTWDYEFIYGMFESIGFEKYASVYNQIKFQVSDAMSMVSLNSCKKEVREFFLLNNFLGNRVSISKDTDNIVQLANEFNENGGFDEMLYRWSNLEYYRYISYDCVAMRMKSLKHYGIKDGLAPVVDSKNYVNKGYNVKSTPVTPFVDRLLRGML